MTKIASQIKEYIDNNDIEEMSTDITGNVCFYIEVSDIDKNEDLEKSIKKYIEENDKSFNLQYMNDYSVAKINEWAVDLRNIIMNGKLFNYENALKINEFLDIFKKYEVTAYKLTKTDLKDGENHEYLYLDEGITGCIRCYELSDARIVITFVGHD